MKDSMPKTRKVIRRRLKLKGVFLLAAFFAAIFCITKTFIKIDVKSYSITGNNFLKDSEIIKEMGLNEKTKFFSLNTRESCKNAKNNPLIRTCKIKRTFDFKLQIIIEENIPLFYYTTESKLVLSDGSRVERTASHGIPTLINYVPGNILEEFTSGLAGIDNDIISSISEIEYTPSSNEDGTYIDQERFMLIMNDGNTVYINNRNIEILGYYKKIYASIGDKKGIYNFDCDYDNYLFKEYGDEDELQSTNGTNN